MSPSLLRPHGHLSPAEALQLAQQAPTILQSNPKAFSSSPLVSLFTAQETPELWIIYENLLLACLRTGDDDSAHKCLERLTLRFGDENERIMALKGLMKEAGAQHLGELEMVLKEYDQILAEIGNGGTNIVSIWVSIMEHAWLTMFSPSQSAGLFWRGLWGGHLKPSRL